eukprot:283705-Amorphochlora_amoeboformis.AAC.1
MNSHNGHPFNTRPEDQAELSKESAYEPRHVPQVHNNPFGGQEPSQSDPFEAVPNSDNLADPFAGPNEDNHAELPKDDPFGAPSVCKNLEELPTNDVIAGPMGGNQAGEPESQPFAANPGANQGEEINSNDPFATPMADREEMTKDDPFGAPEPMGMNQGALPNDDPFAEERNGEQAKE